MLNFLALLGWSPGGDVEVMTVRQMVELFSTEGLSKKAAIFDMTKLEWMNGQHLSMTSASDLAPRLIPLILAAGLASEEELTARREWLFQLIDLLKVRARTLDDVVRQAIPYFSETVEYDAEAVAKGWKDREATQTILTASRDALTSAPVWTADALEPELRRLAERIGVGAGKIFQPLRVALTGVSASPGIFDVLVLLGRQRSLERVDNALRRLAH